MKKYCELIVSRHIDRINPYQFDVILKVSNLLDVDETYNWNVDFNVFKLTQPSKPIHGTNVIPASAEHLVSGWIVDISNIPEHQRVAFAEKHSIKATVGLTSMGMEDFCEAKLYDYKQ